MRVAWATDSMTLASGSSDTTVRIWRLNNQLSLLHDEEDDKKEEEEEKNALGHGYNRSITSSKVKTSISTYNNHRRQRQCHHHQGRDLGFAGTHHLATLAGHEEEVYSCEWLGHYLSPTVDDDAGTNTDSLLLAASGEKLYLWDVSTQQLLSKIPPPNNTTTGGNGNDSSSSNNDASLPSSVSSLVPERWRAGYLFGVACQPGGPLIGAACSDGNLRFWGHSNGGRSIDSLFALPWNSAMGSDCSFMIPGTGTGSSSNSGVEEDASHMFAATAHNGAVVVVDLRTGGCLLHKILTPYDDNSGITSYHTQHQRRDVPCSLFSCELRKIDGRNTVVAASSLGKVALIDVSTGNTRFISPGNSNNSSNGQHSQAVKQQQQQQQTSSPSLLPFLTASVSEDGGRMIAAGECFRLEKGDIEGGGGGDGSIVEKWGPVHVWKVGA
jgi:WD40 repeat protein